MWLCGVGYRSTPWADAASCEGSRAAWVRRCMHTLAGAGLPKPCPPHQVRRSEGVFWGRGKPHTADSGLLCAMFYRIHVNFYPLPSRDCPLEGKALGSRMGNAGPCPRDRKVSVCSLQTPRVLLETIYEKVKAPSHFIFMEKVGSWGGGGRWGHAN